VSIGAFAPLVRFSPLIPVTWTATASSSIDHYDVRRRTTAWNAAPGPWTSWIAGTSATSATFSGVPGQTYCFSARAQDTQGIRSRWTGQRCVVVPLPSDQLSYSAGWTRRADANAFAGHEFRTTRNGARATRSGIVAKRVYVIATKCATCGAVEVRWNGVVLKSIGLSSATLRRNVVVGIATFPTAQAGTLRLTVISPNGKSVRIAGIATYNG
jgi:hypothetical protein